MPGGLAARVDAASQEHLKATVESGTVPAHGDPVLLLPRGHHARPVRPRPPGRRRAGTGRPDGDPALLTASPGARPRRYADGNGADFVATDPDSITYLAGLRSAS